MEPDASEPLEPDRIVTPAEQIKDPREGVADARGAVRRRLRRWGGGRGPRNRSQSSERHNEGRRR
jgi:hypothetical protein